MICCETNFKTVSEAVEHYVLKHNAVDVDANSRGKAVVQVAVDFEQTQRRTSDEEALNLPKKKKETTAVAVVRFKELYCIVLTIKQQTDGEIGSIRVKTQEFAFDKRFKALFAVGESSKNMKPLVPCTALRWPEDKERFSPINPQKTGAVVLDCLIKIFDSTIPPSPLTCKSEAYGKDHDNTDLTNFALRGPSALFVRRMGKRKSDDSTASAAATQ